MKPVPNTCPECGGALTFVARVRLLVRAAWDAKDTKLAVLAAKALDGDFAAARECGKILGTVPDGEEA